jgi:hypothetical protein
MPRAGDLPSIKLGDTVSITDKHLRERIGTITRMNTKTYSLVCDVRCPMGSVTKAANYVAVTRTDHS